MGTHPIFESDFDCLTEETRITNLQPWFECTLQERVSPHRPSPTDDLFHRGKNNQPKKSRTSFTNWPKKGYKPSLIGVHLRDTYGVGKSHYLTGSKILRVLKSLGASPDLPEDLYFMIKKAVGMRKHLERNRKDRDGKFRLILIESRIHRLSRYYPRRVFCHHPSNANRPLHLPWL